jgi:hypothetical protein
MDPRMYATVEGLVSLCQWRHSLARAMTTAICSNFWDDGTLLPVLKERQKSATCYSAKGHRPGSRAVLWDMT